MSIRKFARRLLSPATAKSYWDNAPKPRGTKLGVEAFEDRIVPAFTIPAAPTNGVLTVTNDSNDADLTIKTGANGTVTLTPSAGDTRTDMAGVQRST